jgi:hypothetical protein
MELHCQETITLIGKEILTNFYNKNPAFLVQVADAPLKTLLYKQ